uniref:Uncharacterized protein n=1 Tax=Romanomermis culicivorax TaxID=13658 RepID=A0A915J5R1_ROMCU
MISQLHIKRFLQITGTHTIGNVPEENKNLCYTRINRQRKNLSPMNYVLMYEYKKTGQIKYFIESHPDIRKNW